MSGRWWSAGSVLAALGVAVCCLGPLLFAALGLSTLTSLWLLRHLVPYRNVFLALTFFFLGLAFYATYRRGRRARWPEQAVLWGATALALGLVGYSLAVEGF
ncbi:MAG: hypothetical protein KatS3mg131_2639 [Candidatus Tectimicrobiota bacterium]|nr:MAG: hypothetical protein KatS3mg131_2639 [Candidatus Tectomicrobia bacterium]